MVTVAAVVKNFIDNDNRDNNSLGTITNIIDLLVITNVSFTNLLMAYVL